LEGATCEDQAKHAPGYKFIWARDECPGRLMRYHLDKAKYYYDHQDEYGKGGSPSVEVVW